MTIAKMGTAAALLWGLFGHEYAYYVFLRWLVVVSAVAVSIQFYRQDRLPSSLAFLALAAIFNPLAPVFLTRELWVLIDIGTALGFLWSIGTPAAQEDRDSRKMEV